MLVEKKETDESRANLFVFLSLRETVLLFSDH